MREILFRGKRIDNGEWVEGYFCGKINKTFFAPPEDSTQIIDTDLYWHEVIPKTIGQYTGLTDKNGKKIFEDDIVKVTDDNGETDLCSCGIGDVCFYDGVWYIGGEVNDGLYDVKNIYYIEVIGNIHDNPELLKECEGK